MRIVLLAAASFAGLSITGAAFAQGGPGGPGRGDRQGAAPIFRLMDADGDGKVSKAEFDAYRATQFKALDKNTDGALGREEYLALGELIRTQMIERRFAELDRNKDGKLTADELGARDGRADEAATRRRFEALDKNKDGKLTPDELPEAARERMMRADRGNKGYLTYEEFADFPRRRSAGRGQERFKAMDANGDGAVSKEEYVAWAIKNQPRRDGDDKRRAEMQERQGRFFERIDADRDGKISPAEWAAAGDAVFARLDANKDGAIEPAEIRRGGPRDGARRGERPAPDKSQPKGPPADRGGPPSDMLDDDE
jgi:Ca2+-binding EF-hand superfamily protein